MASRYTPEILLKEDDNLQIQLEIAGNETPPEDYNSSDDEDTSDAPPQDSWGSVYQPSSGAVDLPSSGSVYHPSQTSAISGDSELTGINIVHFSFLSKIQTMFRDSQF